MTSQKNIMKIMDFKFSSPKKKEADFNHSQREWLFLCFYGFVYNQFKLYFSVTIGSSGIENATIVSQTGSYIE